MRETTALTQTSARETGCRKGATPKVGRGFSSIALVPMTKKERSMGDANTEQNWPNSSSGSATTLALCSGGDRLAGAGRLAANSAHTESSCSHSHSRFSSCQDFDFLVPLTRGGKNQLPRPNHPTVDSGKTWLDPVCHAITAPGSNILQVEMSPHHVSATVSTLTSNSTQGRIA